MEVEDWLRRLGLEQYGAAFRDNEIDDTVLPSLKAEDLKDLGVSLVGHRRKLLDAIASLRAEASAVPQEVPNISAEQRQVTVTFADLSARPAFSSRMDLPGCGAIKGSGMRLESFLHPFTDGSPSVLTRWT